MLKYIFAIFLSLFAVSALANIDTRGLPEQQIAELKSIAARAAADNAAEKRSGVTLAQVSEFTTKWGEQTSVAAEGFARALGVAAKELGVAANEFLSTDAGKLTALVIIWKVAGTSILSLIYAIFVLVVGLSVARVIYRRLFIKEYTTVETVYLFGLIKTTRQRPVVKGFHQLSSEGEWVMVLVMLLTVIATLAVASNVIF